MHVKTRHVECLWRPGRARPTCHLSPHPTFRLAFHCLRTRFPSRMIHLLRHRPPVCHDGREDNRKDDGCLGDIVHDVPDMARKLHNARAPKGL